jgi:hypothetical protein
MTGPFLAGQRLTAGQLNDATQKTLDEVEISTAGALQTTSGTTELNITKLVLGPVDLVAGGLYSLEPQLILNNSVATDEFLFKVRKNTPLTGTLIAEMSIWRPNTTLGYSFVTYDDFASAADDPAVTLYCSLVRATGTGTCTIYGQFNTLSRTSMKITRIGYSSALRVVS